MEFMEIVEKNGKAYVRCLIRDRLMVCTPEEIVRQQVLHYMIEALEYPKSMISVEKTISVNNQARRYDIVVYADNQPWLITECKAERVPIDQKVFDQAGGYNIALRVPFLYVTNGKSHFVAAIDFESGKYDFLKKMPAYPRG